jgi:hypothetical protein
MRTLTEAKHAFSAVNKLDQGQTMRLLKIEKLFQSVTEDIFDLISDCPDRTAGLRLLLQAKWTISHAVSHPMNLPPPPKQPEVKNAKEKTENA